MTDTSTGADGTTPQLSAAQLDFLKLSVASAESHLRAYDTKAQITLAAFVLSLNPLWAMFNAACGNGVESRAVTALVVAVLVTLAAYGATVWPAAARGGGAPNYFFLAGDDRVDVPGYLAGLAGTQVAGALAEEAFKLAQLRRAKSRRLKAALACTALAYVVVLVLFVTGAQCR